VVRLGFSGGDLVFCSVVLMDVCDWSKHKLKLLWRMGLARGQCPPYWRDFPDLPAECGLNQI
jgi:hypothetical protein